LVIVPIDFLFDMEPIGRQTEIIQHLQIAAVRAGLKGDVIPVWDAGDRMGYSAPMIWQDILRDMSWAWVISNLNRTMDL